MGNFDEQLWGISASGVTVDTPGNVYVADTGNHRVQKFTSTGTYLTQWGSNGTANGQFDYPRGVAIDPTSGSVQVVDWGNHRVQRFTSGGTYLTKWGTNGTGNGQFQYPFGVTVDSSGIVHVADWGNYRVQRFVPAAPAVTISKSADESTVVAGSAVHYHVTVTNTGNVPLTGVTVTDTKAPACAGSLANIAVGANRLVDCSYTTTHSDVGTYGNSATVDTNETAPMTSSTVNVTVTAAPQSELPPVFVRSWGATGNAPGQFNHPYGVAVAASGDVYVADSSNHRIQQFTRNGEFVRAWGANGTANGQFQSPSGIAVDTTGNVYVADTVNHRIQKFTATGAFVTTWGTSGTGNGQFQQPYGVAVDAAGAVYVADTLNHRVQKFTAAGGYLGQWGSAGTGNGQFNRPHGLTAGPSGDLYVTDTYNNRVQRFSSTGTFLAAWGNVGSANGQFQQPNAAAADAAGNIYVADAGNRRLQKFTAAGVFVTVWGSYGTGDGQFVGGPMGVAVDGSGNVYAVDRSNDRVQQFAPSVIRGTVTEQGTAAPLEGTWVVALRAADYRLLGGTTTATDGTYALPVPVGGYKLEFVDPDFAHDLEFYDDHGFDQLGVADTVTTTLGAATGGIDAALYLPTGAIAGTITEAGTGTPLTNVGVAVMSTSDYHPYSATFTEPDGTYRIDDLPPGDYWVVAALPVGTHEPTFVGGTHTPQGATVITVTPTATTAGADIAVTPTTGPAPTQTLQGTLTDDVTAGPKSGVLVGALRAADFGFVVATFTDATGHYALTVPPGDYYLEFFCTRHCHEFEWYDDEPHPTSPDDLTAVTAPATADAGLTPLRGAMAGTVTDTATTLPLAGVWVAVMRATDGHGVAGATTDASGQFTIDGLGLGDYIVVYIDPSGRHAFEFHDDASDFSHATPLTVTGSHTTTADAALTPTA